MLRINLICLLVTISFVFIGCEENLGDDGLITCTTDFRYGLTLTVYDESSAIVENATVTIDDLDEDYSETIECQNWGGQGCRYVGAGERGGRYQLTVSLDGYNTHQEELNIEEDECHVQGISVDVTLVPSS